MMAVQGVSPFYGGTTLEAFGAFGVGDMPGASILGSWDDFMEVDNNSMFSASSIPVFSMDIPLTAGVDYWMTDDLETAATVVTPEPGVMALFATGMLALSGLRLYRRRKGEADEWPQPFGITGRGSNCVISGSGQIWLRFQIIRRPPPIALAAERAVARRRD
jgi:hypothetical protein